MTSKFVFEKFKILKRRKNTQNLTEEQAIGLMTSKFVFEKLERQREKFPTIKSSPTGSAHSSTRNCTTKKNIEYHNNKNCRLKNVERQTES